MAERLFVYGTLHPDRAPEEIADIVRHFKHLGHGTVRGHYYDLGSYPAVILDQKGKSVHGEVYALPQEAHVLDRLDAYEEYSPASPEQSLFVRKKARVQLLKGSRSECWIYVYNRPIPKHESDTELASVA